jgi:hypothetical protein
MPCVNRTVTMLFGLALCGVAAGPAQAGLLPLSSGGGAGPGSGWWSRPVLDGKVGVQRLERVITVMPDGSRAEQWVLRSVDDAGTDGVGGIVVPSSASGKSGAQTKLTNTLVPGPAGSEMTPGGDRAGGRDLNGVVSGRRALPGAVTTPNRSDASSTQPGVSDPSRPQRVMGSGAPEPVGTTTMLGTAYVPPRGAPRAPSFVQVTDLGTGHEARVAWLDNSVDETGFEIVREKQSGSTWGQAASMAVPADTTTYTDSPGPGVFRYRVRASTSGSPSRFTAWAMGSVSDVAPVAPSGLMVMDLGGGAQISATWTDNSDNEGQFELNRERLSGSTWGAGVTFTTSANVTNYMDQPGAGSFRYRVRAANASGASGYTAWVTPVAAPTPPVAPSGIAAVSLNDGVQTRVTWVDNSADEAGFEIVRETQSGGSWVSPATFTVGENVVVYTDSPGVGTFRYEARAVNGAGPSAYTAWATVMVAGVVPSAPSSLQAVDLGTGSSVRVTWTDNSSNETGFDLAREQLSGATWGSPVSYPLPANTTLMTDTATVGTFRYRARATSSAGGSAYTPWVVVAVAASVPNAPASPVAADIGNGRAMFSWADNSANETGFQIERSPAFSQGTVTVSANVANYVDACGPGSFSYRVRAMNGSQASAWTAWAAVVVAGSGGATPAAPDQFEVGRDFGNWNALRLRWSDNSTDETGFVVERERETSPGVWGETTTLNAPADAVTIADVPGTGRFHYRVAANGVGGMSPWTARQESHGWTVFVPSGDTHVIYVSNSEGNDANSGFDELHAKRTVAAGVALLRHTYPDWLLLKRGDTWDEPLGTWRKCGRSASEPMVVGTYGPTVGERPLLRTGTTTGFTRVGGSASPPTLDYVAVTGVHMVANTYNGSNASPSGVDWLGPGTNFLVEDCSFEGFSSGVVVQATASTPVQWVRVSRSVIADSYSNLGHAQGIYCYAVNHLMVEESVIDHNGWKEGVAVPTMFNHNFYLSSDMADITLRNNIISRASSHGISMNMPGLIEGNLIVRNSIGIFMRTAPATARGNAILEGRDIDPSLPRGFGIVLGPVWPDTPGLVAGPALVENNIIANKTCVGQESAISVSSNVATNNATQTIRNNMVYNWLSTGLNIGNSNTTRYDQVIVQNNSFWEPSAVSRLVNHYPSPVDRTRFQYSGNHYSTQAAASSWFAIADNIRSFAQWTTDSGETGATTTAPTVDARNLSAGQYYANVFGGAATLEAFLADVRSRSRYGGQPTPGVHHEWDSRLAAPAVIRYVRDGFGLP